MKLNKEQQQFLEWLRTLGAWEPHSELWQGSDTKTWRMLNSLEESGHIVNEKKGSGFLFKLEEK